MADSINREVPVPGPGIPESGSPKLSRRAFLGGLIGVGVDSLIPDNPPFVTPISGHEIVLPKEVPAEFKNWMEKIVKISKNFFKKERDIELDFKEGQYGTVKSNRNLGFRVWFTKDKKIHKQTALELGQNLGEYVNSDSNNDPAGKFSRGILEHTGINLSKINDKSISLEDKSKFEALAAYFDFTNYTGLEKGSRPPQNLNNVNELFKNMYSLWICEPDDLAARIGKIGEKKNKIMVANVFLSGLISILDCADPKVKFDSLGLDRKSIDKVIKISGNKMYKNYLSDAA